MYTYTSFFTRDLAKFDILHFLKTLFFHIISTKIYIRKSGNQEKYGHEQNIWVLSTWTHKQKRKECIKNKYYIIIWTDNSLFSENLHGKIFIWQSLKMNIIIYYKQMMYLLKSNTIGFWIFFNSILIFEEAANQNEIDLTMYALLR